MVSILSALAIGILPAMTAVAPSPVHLVTVPAASGPWLDRLNAWRSSAAVSTLNEDTTFSAGDLLHATYMVQTGDVAHSENPAYPQYTAAGNTAAQNSNIFVSSSTGTNDVQAIDWWMGAPFHAQAMMDPRLTTTGFGSYRNAAYTWSMGAALNVGQGMTAPGNYPVYFPGNLSTEPLTTFSGNETPNPQLACPGHTGLPLFIEVGANVNTTAGPATLMGNGTSVTNCVIDSTNAMYAGYLKWRGAVIVFPQQPLQNGVTYTVTLTVNFLPYTWSFTVGPTLSAVTGPTVVGLSPNSGPAAGGTTVMITGTGFSKGMTAVSFGTTPAASFSVVNDTTASAVSPARAVSTVDVTVTTANGTSATTIADQFTFTGMTSYFPWYDLASQGMRADTIHLLNIGASTANITVTMPAANGINLTLAAGRETYVSFGQGHIGGPVLVNSDQQVIATLRAWYYQSFNETPARPASAAATVQYFPWYDLASPGMNADTIHITNVSATTAAGTIALPGATPLSFSVNPGQDSYFAFPGGTIGGPVTLTSSQPVLASLRAWYYQSFNEVQGRSAGAAATTQYFPWYDNASPGVRADTIHITNVSGSTATGTIALPGATSLNFNVPNGQDAYFYFTGGSIGGPVTISSNQPVLASLRAWYYQSFNEVQGRSPGAAATTQYFPWYDIASPGVRADTIHITNVSGSTATGTITLPGAATMNFTVTTGQDAYFAFPDATIGGPVTITSSQPVLAALRAWYYQSFNEVPGYR